MRSISSAFVAALAAAVLVACPKSKPTTAPPTPAPTAGDATCPVEVAGTSVTVEDTATGAALVFVTTGDVAELRRRVAAMAAAHNEEHGKMGPLPTGDEPADGHAGHDMSHMDHGAHDMGAMHHGDGMTIAVHSKADAEEIDAGARLVFTVAPADVAALGDELRMHATHLAEGTCAMDMDMDMDMDHHHHDDDAPPPVDPAPVAVDLAAAETAAYQAAQPVFAKYCAACHQQGAKKATAKKLGHFDMTTYPFGGHHAAEIGKVTREVLGIGGGKPTMPMGAPGSVKGDDLALVAAWADAFDAAHPH
jgi:mono/diheme cytochrome c family protein